MEWAKPLLITYPIQDSTMKYFVKKGRYNMNYQICTRCVMDTTDPEIVFDENGVCNHCKRAIQLLDQVKKEKGEFENIICDIKKEGLGKTYDCIIGVSGGVDSSYVIHYAKELGLRPLAVHIDNGWDSELAIQNIKNLLEEMNIPLYTYVIDWQEFRDLQLAFLKASTPDSEIPSDHTIFAVLFMLAQKYHVKYVIEGRNITSESILPRKWSYGHMDWGYIKDIHRKFGKKPLKTFPYYSKLDWIYYTEVKKIKSISLLNYIDYDKEAAKKYLIEKYGWRDYGGKHYESFYTKFYQSYILPVKFGADKRKMHYSSLIVSGQMSREEALEKLKEPLFDEKEMEKDIEYFCEKMEISRGDFVNLMKLPPKYFWDYNSNENDNIARLIKLIKKLV